MYECWQLNLRVLTGAIQEQRLSGAWCVGDSCLRGTHDTVVGHSGFAH